MKKDTLVTIAMRTGYSVSTVSRVISGNAAKYRISPATVARIMEEKDKSNYIPNILAKGLRTSKTNTIGLIIPDIENAFFAKIASIVMREVHSFGYRVMVIDTQDSLQNETDAVTVLLSQSVDGIIAVPSSLEPSLYENIGIPVVFIYRHIPNSSSISCVAADNYAGAVLAFEHLLENGHEKILCIQGDISSMTNHDRVRGITDTIRKHKMNDSVKIKGEGFSIENGYLETKLALASDLVPTAIFALSGDILMGAIRALNESGKKIPNDISVVAIDDNEVFDYLEPAITCVRQPSDELGSLSVKLLMRAIRSETETKEGLSQDYLERQSEKQTAEPSRLSLAPTLVIRKSVRHISGQKLIPNFAQEF